MTTDDLVAALRRIAIEGWESNKQPVFLSYLPKLLSEALGADYRDLLGGMSLKKFIVQSDASVGYQIAQHPTQRAKVGILPAGVSYEFPAGPDAIVVRQGVSRADVNGFVSVLRSMSTEELFRTSFPASFVVRLLDDK